MVYDNTEHTVRNRYVIIIIAVVVVSAIIVTSVSLGLVLVKKIK